MKQIKRNIQKEDQQVIDAQVSKRLSLLDQRAPVAGPTIFLKKKSLRDIKPLKFVANDTGKTRHYPPGAQEWFNSIYTYNKNLIKTLPVLDKNLLYLLKSYYNMGISHKILNIKR